MAKQASMRVKNKHDTEANWLRATNFVPYAGEIIIYDSDESHSLPRVKIGDGVTTVNNLNFTINDFETIKEGLVEKASTVVELKNIFTPSNFYIEITPSSSEVADTDWWTLNGQSPEDYELNTSSTGWGFDVSGGIDILNAVSAEANLTLPENPESSTILKLSSFEASLYEKISLSYKTIADFNYNQHGIPCLFGISESEKKGFILPIGARTSVLTMCVALENSILYCNWNNTSKATFPVPSDFRLDSFGCLNSSVSASSIASLFTPTYSNKASYISKNANPTLSKTPISFTSDISSENYTGYLDGFGEYTNFSVPSYVSEPVKVIFALPKANNTIKYHYRISAIRKDARIIQYLPHINISAGTSDPDATAATSQFYFKYSE